MVRLWSLLIVLSVSLIVSGCGEGTPTQESTASTESSGEPTTEDTTMETTDPMEMEMAAPEEYMPEETAAEPAEAMYEEYAGMEPGAEGYPGGESAQPKRPEKVEEWTPEQLVAAISSSDKKSLAAIDHVKKSFKGDASDVELIGTWIAALSQSPSQSQNGGEMDIYSGMESMEGQGGGGQTPVKQQISRKLLELLFANKTPASFAATQKILSGESSLGVPQEKVEEWIIAHLMQRAGQSDQAAQGLLWTALTTPPPKAPEPKAEPEKSEGAAEELDTTTAEPGGQQTKPKVSIAERVRRYHIGFLVAAMNDVLGLPGHNQPKPRNQYGGGEDMYAGGEYMGTEPGGQQQPAPKAKPVKIMPVALEQGQVEDALNYLWSSQMVDFACKQLKEHPESTEALIMAAALPAKSTRDAVKSLFESQQDKPPQKWLDQNVFGEQLLDPAIHLIVKSFEREQRPNQSGGGGGDAAYGETGGTAAAAQTARRPRPGAKKPKEPTPEELAQLDASYGWMDASEKSLIANLDRMYTASLQADAVPVDEKELAFALHTGAEITKSVKFQLPSQDHPMLKSAAPVTVNYIRIESPLLNQRTLQFYQSKLKDEQQNTILNGNGLWLDAPVKINHRTNQLLSSDVLISRNNSRPSRKPQQPAPEGESIEAPEASYDTGGAGNGGQTFVVEVLTVEIPDDSSSVSSNN